MQGELDWTADLQLGDESTVRLVVRNVTYQLVRDVTADLDAPFALLSQDRTRRELSDLQAGEEREVFWVVRAAAPLDSGSLHVAVSTSNSGSQQLRRTFRVQEPAAPVPALPSLPLPA